MPTTTTTELCGAPPANPDPPPTPNPMEREILDTRPPPANPPAGCRFTTLIASGDSVTSAHNQEKSGVPGPNKCPGTVKNGNDDRFSYGYRAFTALDRFKGGDYYNFARTGFGTVEMRGPKNDGKLDPTTKDACDNAWGDTIRHPDNRGSAPKTLVLKAIEYELAKKKDPVWVSSGGVNNTNWVTMLKGYAACHVLRLMFSDAPGQTMSIRGEFLQAGYTTNNAVKKAHDDALEVELITKGGKCQFIWNVGVKKFDSGQIDVPPFDVAPRPAPGVGRDLGVDILFMVQDALLAGAKQVVWVAYFDMSYAQVDPKRLLLDYGVPEEWVPNLRKVPFFETPGAQAEVRKHLDNLQDWICAGVAQGKLQADATAQANGKPKPGPADCIGWKDSGFTSPDDIQDTAPGGSPHPSEAGHKKLAAAVQKKL